MRVSDNDRPIDVLLATWRGERWLPEQLASLMAQSDQGFRILVRDDGSDDGTRRLIEDWAARHPGRIALLPDDGRRLGACGNFGALLAASTAPYVMFCDQDDRWRADKIARSRAALARLEAQHGPETPLLVHGDVDLVDAELRPLGSTLSRAIKVPLDAAGDLRLALVQNVVTGCTMLFNRPLVDASLPVPSVAVMHDWWVALVAAAGGRVATVSGTLLDYRQHGGNAIGSGGMRLGRLWSRFAPSGAVRARFAKAGAQAQELLQRRGEALSDADQRLCRAVGGLSDRGWWGRRATVVRHRLWMTGTLRNLGMMASL